MNSHLLATTPRMQIVWDVLEAAKDKGDEMAIAACRRLIIADPWAGRSMPNAATSNW